MRETINQDKKEKLLKRKQEIELLVADGYEFETIDIDSVDDEEIAFHKMVSDLIIKLQGMRKAKGLTQTVVAQRMRTKQTAISRFEKYCGVPTLDFIYNYAFAIGVKVDLSIIENIEYTQSEEKPERLTKIAEK